MKKFKSLFFIFCLIIINYILCDVYMHNPRGCNNRLNESGQNRDNNNRLYDTQNNAKGGYCWGPEMYFYTGSILQIEWSSQHSCGHENAECELVLQYMCGSNVRDGRTTQTPPDNNDPTKGESCDEKISPDPLTGENEQVFKFGMHESYEFYQECKNRDRNNGLFLADQRPGSASRNTRQNPGGTRNGFECPEERDYYPYWHPSPWKDIAILTNNISRCEFYKTESQNVQVKGHCSNYTRANNKIDCETNKGIWNEDSAWNISAPDCILNEWTRDNHLGNAMSGLPQTFNWTLPNIALENCVIRLRYNISTTDYDNWNIDSRSNGKDKSPIVQDADINVAGRNLTMAFNTNQAGRTFQDRSYVFHIRDRPESISSNTRIYNLNVRGKRGNIVQVYPAVEYDFVPNLLNVNKEDLIHIQWTGCDTNPQNNDGEGTRGTDRSNIIQLIDLNKNYPPENQIFSQEKLLFDDSRLRDTIARAGQTDDICLSYSQLRQEIGDNKDRIERDPRNCAKLNAGPAYFDGGLIKLNNSGKFNYMCSRNNNFSNRSQKGTIIVEESMPSWAIALIVIGSLLVVFIVAILIAAMYGYTHPNSSLGKTYQKLTKSSPEVA
eukprot:TRINITY_DN1420_c0_g1_i3.p1 TRINITY_DN1420_c0_g1~~TRINITY_DN1420_c0_g1_i3.p1  ORF type:complete len:608 (+),score=312.09 TRINITY_DN1420_c0_g1_i3:76-1899(+)